MTERVATRILQINGRTYCIIRSDVSRRDAIQLPSPLISSVNTDLMIRLDNISKQNGHQILFIDASMGLQKGEKVGLVGPNRAGKTKIFRMIAGEERPDDGQVSVETGKTIGYFSQDVGEM